MSEEDDTGVTSLFDGTNEKRMAKERAAKAFLKVAIACGLLEPASPHSSMDEKVEKLAIYFNVAENQVKRWISAVIAEIAQEASPWKIA